MKAAAKIAEKNKVKGLSPFQRQKQVAELEKQIHDLETRLAVIIEELGSASTAGQVAKVAALGEEYNQKEALLHNVMEQWAELAD